MYIANAILFLLSLCVFGPVYSLLMCLLVDSFGLWIPVLSLSLLLNFTSDALTGEELADSLIDKLPAVQC